LSVNNAADIAIERLLERAVAQACKDSPRAVALIDELQGRTLAVRVSGFPWSLTVESTGRTLRTCTTDRPDATISGAPLSLLALLGDDPQAVISRGDVQTEGDAQLAQQFRELGLLLRPDLEAGMSRLLGRSGAHVAMRGFAALRDWARATAWTATQNAAEYLAHERGDLVSRMEAEHYLRDVDRLREQFDRLQARLQHLETRERALAGGREPP
jgi:ubiquinone biosynthesis protein UbiJ